MDNYSKVEQVVHGTSLMCSLQIVSGRRSLLKDALEWRTVGIVICTRDCDSYIGDSRPFRPGCDPHNCFFFFFFFFFIQVCYRWPQKMTCTNFQIFFENFSGSNGRNRREIRAEFFFWYTSEAVIVFKPIDGRFVILWDFFFFEICLW